MISNRKASGNLLYSLLDRLEKTIKPRCERPLPPLQLRENGCKLVTNYNPFRRTPKESKTVRHFSYERTSSLTERSPANEKVLEVLPMNHVLPSKESSKNLADIHDGKNLAPQTDYNKDRESSERIKGQDEEAEASTKTDESLKKSSEEKEMHENSKVKVELVKVQPLLSSKVLFLR